MMSNVQKQRFFIIACAFLLTSVVTPFAWSDEPHQILNKKMGGKNQHPPRYNDYFIAFHGGGAFPGTLTSLLNNGYIVGAEYGYRDSSYRALLSVDFLNNALKQLQNAEYNMTNIMLSLIYDLNYTGVVVPFLGGGIGYENLSNNHCTASNISCNQLISGSQFGYQGILGLGYSADNGFRVDFRYRYLSFFKSNHFYQNIAEIVLSYYFKNPT